MKDTKQGVSKFTEKDLTPEKHVHIYSRKDDRITRLCAICGHPEKGPLETHVQSELEKIQAGHEGYKVVPVELWNELQENLLIASAICVRNGYKETSKAFIELHERTNKI